MAQRRRVTNWRKAKIEDERRRAKAPKRPAVPAPMTFPRRPSLRDVIVTKNGGRT